MSSRSTQPSSDVQPYQASEVRAWLKEQGVEVGSRGRINRAHFVNYLTSEPERRKEIAKELVGDAKADVEAVANAMARPQSAPGRAST
jgi:hypothetical protein